MDSSVCIGILAGSWQTSSHVKLIPIRAFGLDVTASPAIRVVVRVSGASIAASVGDCVAGGLPLIGRPSETGALVPPRLGRQHSLLTFFRQSRTSPRPHLYGCSSTPSSHPGSTTQTASLPTQQDHSSRCVKSSLSTVCPSARQTPACLPLTLCPTPLSREFEETRHRADARV